MFSPHSQFAMAITSDPQYPWYENKLPPGIKSDDKVNENSRRQIREQYESISKIAGERDKSGHMPLKGVIANGDLTAFGHDWQLEEFKNLTKLLKPKFFPGLGNHDYQNNVDDTHNNNAASRMVDYMYQWLKENASFLSYDFTETSYYKFPELRTDFHGSLSYSFNIGKVHFIQLQNFPSYTDDWNTWNAGSARRDYYYISPSFYWLRNDLAISRNRGDIIIVNLHDYHDNFDADVDEFNALMREYEISAVFGGHIHGSCGLAGKIEGSAVPFFRSGASSWQDYLIADFDADAKLMTVRKMACPDGGTYAETGEKWGISLIDTTPSPPMHIPDTSGFVTFFNDGGFGAQFSLQYSKVNGDRVFESTGTLLLGNKKKYELPPDSTDIWLVGKENTGLVWEGWRTVFDLRYSSPPNRCYRLFGTTLDPKWNNDC